MIRTMFDVTSFEFSKHLSNDKVAIYYVVYRPYVDQPSNTIVISTTQQPYNFSARKQAQILFAAQPTVKRIG